MNDLDLYRYRFFSRKPINKIQSTPKGCWRSGIQLYYFFISIDFFMEGEGMFDLNLAGDDNL